MIEISVKTWGDMSKIQTKQVVFFYDTYPQIYIKKVFNTYGISNLKQFHWLTRDDMEFELWLRGQF